MFLLVTGASGAGKSTARRSVAQTDRLARRGDDAALLPHHHAFADWMRGHARDPRLMPRLLSTDGCVAMRWERLTGIDRSDGSWGMEVLDTSHLAPEQVADEIVTWCRRACSGQAPLLYTPARIDCRLKPGR
jgi:hypothetical protein